MNRRTGGLVAGFLVFAGLTGVVVAATPLDTLLQDVTNPAASAPDAAGASAPGLTTGLDRPAPPSFGPPELSPTTAASLWPVPSFKDSCQLAATDRDPIDNPGAAACGPQGAPAPSGPPDHRDAMELAALAAGVGLVGAGALGAGWLAYRRRRRADQIRRWRAGTVALDETAAEVMKFELDPLAPYTRPLLGDVTEPATAAFYSAYSAAQHRHAPTIPPDEESISGFVAAATAARRAFEVADLNARTKAQNLPCVAGSVAHLSARRDQ